MTLNIFRHILSIGDYMNNITTIQIDKSVVDTLKKIKKHPRQSYNEVIINLIKISRKTKLKNQYTEFLHKIQQPKMKELWDNKEDEVWDNV
jgi:predicted CopG family antitoxin